MSGIRLYDYRANSDTDTTVNVDRGPGYLPGDVIVATVILRNNATITPPDDFTLIDDVELTTVFKIALYYHVVSTVDLSLAPYEWAVSSISVGWHVMHAVFRGVDPDTPVEASFLTAARTNNLTTDAENTAGNRFSLLTFAARSAATLTPDSALKEIYDGTDSSTLPAGWMGWRMVALPGEVGPFDFSIASEQDMGVAHIVLRPATETLTLPNISGAARVMVADRSGRYLADITPTISGVSWRLGRVGRGKLEFLTADPAMVEDILQFGNLVLIEFENGMQAWGGFMDPGRRWDVPGGAVVDLYDGVQLLAGHTTPKTQAFTEAAPNHVFDTLLRDANTQQHATRISIGAMNGGDERITVEYHYTDLLTIFQKLFGVSTSNEFVIEMDTTQNRLRFVASIWRRVGRRRMDVALIEGHNVVALALLEQGPIVNYLDMAASGSDWGVDRITTSVQDDASIAKYGLRKRSIVRSDIDSESLLRTEAEVSLAEKANPKPIWDVQVVNVAPALFANYGIGDTVRLMAYTIGFNDEGVDRWVRVLEREYDPFTGICRLIVQEEDD